MMIVMLCGVSRFPKIRKTGQVLAVVFSLAAVLGVLLLTSEERLARVRDYFRVGGSAEEIAEGRRYYWEFAVQDIQQHWLFGRGPMAKFAGGGDVTKNTYDEKQNPHNTWLITAQSYGILGAILYAAAFLAMLSQSLRGQGTIPALAAGIIVMGFGMSICQNWSFSFGEPADRAFWLLLGSAIALPQPYSRELNGWKNEVHRYSAGRHPV